MLYSQNQLLLIGGFEDSLRKLERMVLFFVLFLFKDVEETTCIAHSLEKKQLYLSLTTWFNGTQDTAEQEMSARGKLKSQESVCAEDIHNFSHSWSNTKEATVSYKTLLLIIGR